MCDTRFGLSVSGQVNVQFLWILICETLQTIAQYLRKETNLAATVQGLHAVIFTNISQMAVWKGLCLYVRLLLAVLCTPESTHSRLYFHQCSFVRKIYEKKVSQKLEHVVWYMYLSFVVAILHKK